MENSQASKREEVRNYEWMTTAVNQPNTDIVLNELSHNQAYRTMHFYDKPSNTNYRHPLS